MSPVSAPYRQKAVAHYKTSFFSALLYTKLLLIVALQLLLYQNNSLSLQANIT